MCDLNIRLYDCIIVSILILNTKLFESRSIISKLFSKFLYYSYSIELNFIHLSFIKALT